MRVLIKKRSVRQRYTIGVEDLKNLSKGAKPSQKDRKQHQVAFYLLYSSSFFFLIDRNSQFDFPCKLLYYAWASCGFHNAYL